MPPPPLEKILPRKALVQQDTTALPRISEQYEPHSYCPNLHELRQETQQLSLMPTQLDEFEDGHYYEGFAPQVHDVHAKDGKMHHHYTTLSGHTFDGGEQASVFNTSGGIDGLAPRSSFGTQLSRSNWKSQAIEAQNGFQYSDDSRPTGNRLQYRNGDDSTYQRSHPRQPLQTIPANQNRLQQPQKSRYQHVGPRAETPLFRSSQPGPGSVSSPFFQRDTSTAHSTFMQRPTTRRVHDRASTQFGRMGHVAQGVEMPRGQVVERDTFGQRQSPTVFSGARPPIENRYYERQPPMGPPGDYALTAHMPHQARRSYTNYAYGPPSRHSLINEPQVSSPRGRITLPLSSSRAQDNQLANIKGLRGGFPQQTEDHSARQKFQYSGSRPLFSAASRRSVRR